MKKLSIKLQMTLWYAALMFILVVLVLGFMIVFSNNAASESARNRLVNIVDENTDEVEYDDGELDIDDDFVYTSDGVTCVIYTTDQILAGGHLPSAFTADLLPEDGAVRSVTSSGQKFFIYDRLVRSKKQPDLWVRGIVAADGSTGIVGTVTAAACLLLPFVVIICALIGYQITRRLFGPIDKITQAANAISEGSNLKQRINLGEGSDEIHRLADTFDLMFSRLEASFEEERQFTSDVSHELRTPVSVIRSQCEYALSHAVTIEEYREALETAERQAVRMSRLIAQLLSFTRLEQGVERACVENTNLSELVELICEEQPPDEQKHITVSAAIAPDIYAAVDRSMIIRLLSNLLDNARQYGKENGHVQVCLQRAGTEIHLSVADDGIGITKEESDRIWKRFYQVNPARSTGQNGSMGLGLAMVSQIARLHGGHMKVQSEPGRGSTFIFVLPAIASQDSK